jgi:uncharacterized protein
MFGRKHRRVTDELTGLDRLAGTMVGIGALNWGLVGLANFDAIRAVFGKSKLARAVYGLVGASAAYAVIRGRQLVGA